MSTTNANAGSASLLDLPHELVEEILVRCDPVDVARASMACRRLYGVVYGVLTLGALSNVQDGSGIALDGVEKKRRRVLWRELYLNQPLDDLRKCVNWLGYTRATLSNGTPNPGSSGEFSEEEEDIDWEKEMQSVIRARTLLSDWVPPVDSRVDLARNLVWVPVTLKEFLDIVEGGVVVLPSSSLESAISQSTTTTDGEEDTQHTQWKLPPKEQWTTETKQLHAQLRTLYGLTRSDLTRKRRVESRGWVYDMRKYTPGNEYGPLRDGAKYVDWELLERVHHVVSMHIVWESVKGWVESGVFDEGVNESEEGPAMKKPGFEYMIYPLSMPFTQAVCMGNAEGSSAEGMRGKVASAEQEGIGDVAKGVDWVGVGGTWSIFFCFCDHRELMDFNGSVDADGKLDTSLFEDEEFTEVFRKIEVNFKVTRVANDPEHPGRPIIGFLTADNHIKWQFYSGDAGERAIWSSVGIQVGGVGSSYGVLGCWTTVFHDSDDPVGPFWMQRQTT
ncbi:hypothetical protein D9756_005131 [Leucocoprinus leucothites]|uniref:F-box domain-containing protein n=1 Tax=Leucocoprinus leucothites TaxID=201217 RepID=A0A8H5LKM7_9AGAR|nr:hypothetical protein D9756_005131 [Leucoagaricus leucothites]